MQRGVDESSKTYRAVWMSEELSLTITAQRDATVTSYL